MLNASPQTLGPPSPPGLDAGELAIAKKRLAPLRPRALTGEKRPSRGKASEPIRKSESFRIRSHAPWGLCPQTPGIFRGMAPKNQLIACVPAQHYNKHRWMKRNGALWGHNSARDNSVADKSTLIEHVSGCRPVGNN
jgi:hypothetical protein